MILRDAVKSDWAAILALNEESVQFLSPMDSARLTQLAKAAHYLRVIEQHGKITAFLLAFRKSDDYDGANFAWFSARFEDFLYVDRIVVSPAFRGAKLADRLYDDLEALARATGVTRITCEVNVEPPNPVSLRFHARRGFREADQRRYAGKTVAMLEHRLPAP